MWRGLRGQEDAAAPSKGPQHRPALQVLPVRRLLRHSARLSGTQGGNTLVRMGHAQGQSKGTSGISFWRVGFIVKGYEGPRVLEGVQFLDGRVYCIINV